MQYKTFWVVIDPRGTAFLVSARLNRSKSIEAWVNDAESDEGHQNWEWWKRLGYRCQQLDIKVRPTANVRSTDGRKKQTKKKDKAKKKK